MEHESYRLLNWAPRYLTLGGSYLCGFDSVLWINRLRLL